MASAPVLDFATLLEPVPGEHPAGSPVPLTVRQKLESLRKEFEPNPENPGLAPIPKKPDWPKILQMTREVLTQTSKDLETSFRLAEALVKLHGYAGLRDGLHLLADLVDQCWDRIHPFPDEGEGMEVRAERFYWITDPDKGARFPVSIRSVPTVLVKGEPASYQDLLLSMHGQGTIAASAFEGADLLSSDVMEDLAQAMEELDRLDGLLNEKCERDAPGLSTLRQAMDDCRRFLVKVAPQPDVPAPAEAAPEAFSSGQAAAPAVNGSAGPIHSREEAYRQLGQIANVLERLEPHSPIPYLLRRAIELGRMPFRQLIHELVREPNMLAEIRREFGIKENDETPVEAPAPPAEE